MNKKTYLIDTNILIESKNRYYSFSICPGFWDALILQDSQSTIMSIDKVKDEINRYKYEDDLKAWVNSAIPDSFFKSTENAETIKYYGEIINWVQGNPQFLPEAKAEFIQDECDPWLIAFAKANNCVLITNEVIKKEAKAKVPIPNVCGQFNIECQSPFKMLEELGIQFSLKI
ncbi:MAG: DUF4411 family protein [Ignavibacteriaceae bacterium]|nr:DUF4411 family protein [Ignavibacteriaceae bacterium]